MTSLNFLKMEKILIITFLLASMINSASSFQLSRRQFQEKPTLFSSPISSWRVTLNRMASTDEANNDDKIVDTTRTTSRPPIIPFDFARDDILPPKVIEKVIPNKAANEDPFLKSKDSDRLIDSVLPPRSASNKWVDDSDLKTAVRSTNGEKRNKWVEDPSRPTGYGNVDEDDDDWVPSADSEGVEKFLKDYFFNSPYDSPKRKDAKFVIRNVTLISGVLGTVFTILFYAFPGKFISYRGTADFSKRYSSDFIVKDPSELLNDQVNEDLIRNVEIGGERFFDDAVGLPLPDNSRVAYPMKPSEARAPGRTENL